MSKTSSSSSTYDSLSNHTSVATSIPFPTSASTPNFKSLSAADEANKIDETKKRDSQTILCQGFLQRKADYSPAALASTSGPSPLSSTYPLPSVPGSNSQQAKSTMIRKSSASTTASAEIDLQRGWRPFKVILQGSKLYLFKIPNGELNNTVKSLFPTTIVIDSESPVIPVLPSPRIAGNANSNLDEFGARKKQRAFWGTGKVHHPGLVVSEGKGKEKEVVTGGSLEALVHELVFATTFLDAPTGSPAPDQFSDSFEEVVASREATINLDSREREYEKFLNTLLTFWPFLPTFTPKSFSLELDRCSVLGVRTIVEAHAKDPTAGLTKESAQLLGRRLELILHGLILSFSEDLLMKYEGSDVKDAVRELIRLLGNLEEIYLVEGEPKIALELAGTLSRVLDSPSKAAAVLATEWTNARLGNGRNGSSSTNLNSTSSTPVPNSSPTKPKKKLSPTPANQEFESAPLGFLNHSNLLNFDALHLAQQIRLFHQDRYIAVVSGVDGIRRMILKNANSLSVEKENTRSAPILSLFSFSPSRPSYLARIIYSTIFPSPSATLLNLVTRIKIIERWISVAEELRTLADASGYVAVASTICSPAVARLSETWKSIDTAKIDLIRNEWVPILAGLRVVGDDGIERTKSLVLDGGVPYWGDVLEATSRTLKDSKHRAEDDNATVDLNPFYALREAFQDIESTTKELSGDSTIRPDSELQYFFQSQSRLSLPVSSTYFSASLEVEPKISGLGADLYTKSRPSASDPPPLLPLLMVEPLPHISLVDREKIIQAAANVGVIPRKQSNSELGSTQEFAEKGSYASRANQPGRLVRHNSFPPSIIATTADVGLMAKLRLELNRKSESERNLVRLVDGGLILRIITSTVAGSGPTTPVTIKGVLARTASWIEAKSTKAGRRASIASISTLSPITQFSLESGSNSKRSSMVSTRFNFDSEESQSSSTVEVVVKSGAIESLVDLLVIGIPPSLRIPSTIDETAKSIKHNSKDFRNTFFSTYRSFVTPIALLDMLRKRYISARNATSSREEISLERPFPIWSTSPREEVDWKQVLTIRTSIVAILRHWVDQHLSDFLNDEELYSSFSAFLNFMRIPDSSPGGSDRLDEKVREEISSLSVRFLSESFRPPIRSRSRAGEAMDRPAGLSFDRLSVSELVDRLDMIASDVNANVTGTSLASLVSAVADSTVTEQDLISYAELLEGSSATNPVAWYSSRALSKNVDDEDVVIQDPYSHLNALGPDTTFLLSLPHSLREGLKAHQTLRRWILAHLVDPDLTLSKRQARMEKAIAMVETCRARMSNVVLDGKAEAQKSAVDPSLASFVERVVISAVVAPESRLFASAWQGVAFARRVINPDSLAALIKKDLVLTDATSTLDLAWLNERLLEIVTQVEGGTSVNFDKRRALFTIVSSALAIRPAQTGSSEQYLEVIEKRLAGGWGTWGMRLLRDVASGEGTKATKSVRPFHKLVVLQQEKMRRDRHTREYLVKGMKLESKEAAKAMEKSSTKNTRRMTAIFKIARPESPVSPSSTALQTLNEWTPSGKPFLVYALAGVQVVSVDNVQRSFVFELATEDGQRSIFQATAKSDLENWMRNLRQSGNQIAFRRATFLAQTALAEEPEEPIVTKPSSQQSTGAKGCQSSFASISAFSS